MTKAGSRSGSLKESKSTSKEQIPSRGKTGGEKLSTDLGVSENRRDEGVLEPVSGKRKEPEEVRPLWSRGH